jgi:GNAT superfamily N-acetyltransferase
VEIAECSVDRPEIRRDILGDLLSYEPANAHDLTSGAFLRTAMARFERGDHVYTYVEDGVLIAHAWITRVSKGDNPEAGGFADRYLPGTVVLDGFAARPGYRERGLFRATVARIIKDLTQSGETSRLVVAALSDDPGARQVLDEFGFDLGSTFEVRPDRTEVAQPERG